MPNISEEKGSSLVLALTVAALLFTLVSVLIHFTGTELRSAAKQKLKTCAYYTAEAGIDRAVLEINQKIRLSQPPVPLLIPNEPYHQGFYSVEAQEKFNQQGEHAGYAIVSEGRCGDETKRLTALARRPVWPENGEMPEALSFAMFGENSVNVRSLSGLLGLGGLLSVHSIKVDGNVHANHSLRLKHESILFSPPPPRVNGIASSTSMGNIHVDGLKQEQKKLYPRIPLPQFDFDAARKAAKEKGKYFPGSVLNLSLLGLGSAGVVFIDGDLTLAGVDLLGIALNDRTIVVNGNVSGLLEVGGNTLVSKRFNLIAKGDIQFLGAVTGLVVNGVLFSQGDISIEGHAEVKGFIGARNIKIGGGLVSNLLGLVTGDMEFEYDAGKLNSLPQGIGFHADSVEVVEQGE